MHMFLPSNACVEHFPDNGPAQFQINLPDTLHFPNHEVCLERIYYGKEFSSTKEVQIEIAINQETWTQFAEIYIPPSIKDPSEFVDRLFANLTLHEEETWSVSLKRSIRNTFIITNILNNPVSVRFPSQFIKTYNLKIYTKESDLEAGLFTPLPESFVLGSRTSAWIESFITEPVTSSFRGIVEKQQKPINLSRILQGGYFATGNVFVAAINKVIWDSIKHYHAAPKWHDGPFTFNAASNRCVYTAISDHFAITLGTAARILGFKGSTFAFTSVEAVDRVDFTEGIQSLYVYSSIVDSVIVGDVKVPLLGVIPLNRKIQGEREYYEFVNPPYLPLVRHPFKTLEFQLCDDMGQTLKRVLIGKTIICINIRAQQL